MVSAVSYELVKEKLCTKVSLNFTYRALWPMGLNNSRID